MAKCSGSAIGLCPTLSDPRAARCARSARPRARRCGAPWASARCATRAACAASAPRPRGTRATATSGPGDPAAPPGLPGSAACVSGDTGAGADGQNHAAAMLAGLWCGSANVRAWEHGSRSWMCNRSVSGQGADADRRQRAGRAPRSARCSPTPPQRPRPRPCGQTRVKACLSSSRGACPERMHEVPEQQCLCAGLNVQPDLQTSCH